MRFIIEFKPIEGEKYCGDVVTHLNLSEGDAAAYIAYLNRHYIIYVSGLMQELDGVMEALYPS